MSAAQFQPLAFPIADASLLHRIGAAAIEGITDTAARDRIYTAVTAQAAQGMTLRDHFAGQAMQAYLGGHIAHHGHESYWPPKDIAGEAYGVADAMLQARQAAPSLLTELAQALDVLLQTTVDADINDGFVLTDEKAEARSTALAVLAKVRGAA